MAQDNSNQPPSTRPADPRLKSFLRKATAIIAAEKGLNSESRRKLENLGEHLKMPPALLAEGLQRLQQGVESAANLTHYERAFVKLLDKDFEKITGGIISPSVEAQAISMAKRKYEINSTRAEQLIAARAEAAGLGLISSQEAEAFAEHAMIDRIGTATEIGDETYDEILKIGRKWGLGQYQIERIVGQIVDQNVADQQPRWNRKLIAIVTLLVVLGGGLLGTAFATGWFPDRWVGWNAKPNQAAPDFPELPVDPVPATRFSPETSGKLKITGDQSRALKTPIQEILSDEPDRRSEGYRQLVDAAVEDGNPDRDLAVDLVSDLFFEDPDDDAAKAILDSIQQRVSFLATDSISVRDLENSFHANALIGRLKEFPNSDSQEASPRQTSIDDLASTVTGLPAGSWASAREYLLDSERAIANEQWNRVMQIAWSDPARAAVLLDAVVNLTRTRLEDNVADQTHDEAVLAILAADPSNWKVLKKNIKQSIQRCDDSKLTQWVAIFESSDDPHARDLIAEFLLPRIGIQPAARSREDQAKAITQYGFQIRTQALQPVIDRIESLDTFFESMIELDSIDAGATILPDRIAQLALAVNTEWAFCAALENQTHIDDTSFAEFDRLIAYPPPRLRHLIGLPIDRRSTKPAGSATATASDRRRMRESLDRLEQLDLDSSKLRIQAVKQLKQIAHRFERISYAESNTIATYLLSELDVEELLNVQQLMENFSHWPNLALAIADQLPSSDVPMDQVMAISQRLLRRELEISGKYDWKKELSFLIIQVLSDDLENQVDQDPDNVKSNWNRLQIFLSELYRERLALGTNRQYINEDFAYCYQATEALAVALAERTPTAKHRRLMARSIQLIRDSNASEIEKACFANQLLIQQLADEISALESGPIGNQILAELESDAQHSSLAGKRLLATEVALLKLINQKRLHLLQRLLAKEGLQ